MNLDDELVLWWLVRLNTVMRWCRYAAQCDHSWVFSLDLGFSDIVWVSGFFSMEMWVFSI